MIRAVIRSSPACSQRGPFVTSFMVMVPELSSFGHGARPVAGHGPSGRGTIRAREAGVRRPELKEESPTRNGKTDGLARRNDCDRLVIGEESVA